MNKNKIVLIIITFSIFFSTLFSFSSSYASEMGLTEDEIKSRLDAFATDNPFEMTLVELLMGFGDFVTDYITYIFKDEITIDRLVFNKVLSLNANFFEFEKKGLVPETTEIFCNVINTWYKIFRGLAIVVYLIVLIVVGIRVMLGTANSKAKAQDIIYKWGIGVAILFLFPFVMKYAFKLNDGIIDEIRKTFRGNNPYDEIVGAYVGKITDVQYDQVFEERSPEYITRGDYIYSVGSTSATFAYIRQLEKYKDRGDIMRIMRAMVGITARLMYAIVWYIMLWQMITLIFIYTKRYLMIAFLIMIFPITVLEYIIGAVGTGKSSSFSSWCMEFFLNVFIQTIHAIIYGIIGGIAVANVRSGIANGMVDKANWIILIVAINFIFEGEKIVKKIIKANAASLASSDTFNKNAKAARGKVTKGAKGIGHMGARLMGGKGK